MSNSFHMSPDDFQKWGHAVVDWIAEYQRKVETYPVLSPVKPGDVRTKLPDQPPQKGQPFDEMLKDMDRVVMPGITHWQSPNFYAYFPGNNSGPSILGELLSAGLGVQGMLWATSPACTELETHVLDWLVGMLGLPEKFKSTTAGGGVIQDTASNAVLCAIIAARERATRGQSNAVGCDGSLTVYTSDQAHSSVEKAVKVAGLGRNNLRLIETDDDFAMKPHALIEAVEVDRRAGRRPCLVVGTAGTTSSNGFDPLAAIGGVCRREDMWFHVDAAMSGSAAVCPEFRVLQDGVELADSYAFNPHKWMFTNFDCDCFYVADRAALIRALSVLPEYLKNQASDTGAVIDYRDWHVQLGRRFRALKLWFVIRHYGIEGLQHHIRQHVALTRELADWIRKSPEFELVMLPKLNLICFARRAGDEFNRRLLEKLNATGKIYLTHTVLRGRYVLRLCVGQSHTQLTHVKQAWELIRNTAREIAQSPA